MADPGFPRGGANSPGVEGAPTYDFAKFFQKLDEIERIWTPEGEGPASKILLCRSATVTLPHILFQGSKECLEFWQMLSSEKIDWVLKERVTHIQAGNTHLRNL